MAFERVRTEEQRKIRIQQIKDAAVKLFDEEPFHEITLAKIAQETSFTRGNLYKYISSKEEIFLLVTMDEILSLKDDLMAALHQDMTTDIAAFARTWASVVGQHPRFLQLTSLLFTVIERNATLEKLVPFKNEFAEAMYELTGILKETFPSWDETTIQKFIQSQLHYAIGLYPNTSPSDIQKQAVEESVMAYVFPDFTEEFAEFIEYTVRYLQENQDKVQ
ncbi:TetR/AcrR family transcriptional regulator [Halobacillus sp. Cin3]|uniref:TetR/AcrR family transcriptional regulator n=1 Tax=Halobacillus sp. Cin3 TaxID=2928441 RepID=UPI00248E8C13|nr:TetR/AcrR family transcriptional regulator [Halobacillus sp. Cin3]